ncbi:MAG: isoprenylcysteine carboxylmethyltransferase family protein [Candidatus Heimdallarchaeota archaeon]|nr:MAG: isoprenylcysteine carboxylmethyltransferase family protein [Candidatus Heimdallarchaeota archaeon]
MPGQEHSHGIGEEHPRSHEFQLIGVILFLMVWGIDSLFNLTTQLSRMIPWQLRLLIFIGAVLIALRLANGSHKLVLVGVDKTNPKVVDEDVYAMVRHPMYFAYIIGYLGLIILTLSIISFIPFLIAFFLLDLIAAYEENELIEILGQEYLDYMKKVPRWVPNPFKFFKRQKNL